jgi:hypothetical protein
LTCELGIVPYGEQAMASNQVRYIPRVSLALLLTAAIIAAFYVAYVATAGRLLENALLLAWAVGLGPLFSNSHPPATADGLFTSWDSRLWGEDHRKFIAILEQKFPVGTNEAQLKSTLLSQGFKPATARNCEPESNVYHRCPPHDQRKGLSYAWNSFPCGQFIEVWWTAGDSGDINWISGNHFGGCL